MKCCDCFIGVSWLMSPYKMHLSAGQESRSVGDEDLYET